VVHLLSKAMVGEEVIKADLLRGDVVVEEVDIVVVVTTAGHLQSQVSSTVAALLQCRVAITVAVDIPVDAVVAIV
jgi:soluble P-type ATPase